MGQNKESLYMGEVRHGYSLRLRGSEARVSVSSCGYSNRYTAYHPTKGYLDLGPMGLMAVSNFISKYDDVLINDIEDVCDAVPFPSKSIE